MKILDSHQTRSADQFTIENEPIASINLMERASEAFVQKFEELYLEKMPVHVFCATGNNGGDGLAISRILLGKGWDVIPYVIGNLDKGSKDFLINLDRISSYIEIKSISDFPDIIPDSIVIDGLFGSGLSRPIQGIHADLINFLNQQNVHRVTIDIASGLYADESIEKGSIVFKPNHTITFQNPKLTFFLPDYHQFVGDFHVVDIGLDQTYIDQLEANSFQTQAHDVKHFIPIRSKFTHKHEVGKLQIIAGSKGKMGAAILCAKAAFRAGVGLVNVHAPKCGVNILQATIPEAMVSEDASDNYISSFPTVDDIVAIGPGLGTEELTAAAFAEFLTHRNKPFVIDADGINLLSMNDSLLELLPKESILTPHVGEFRRLVGDWGNDFDKLEKLRSLCIARKLNVVLKGAYSAVCNSMGEIHFNSTGNPSMATAGSGDVLTGVVASLLAKGLEPFSALKLGVYVHGLAGDLAAHEIGSVGIIASDIIEKIPEAFDFLNSEYTTKWVF